MQITAPVAAIIGEIVFNFLICILRSNPLYGACNFSPNKLARDEASEG
jgi:hypothetical protein